RVRANSDVGRLWDLRGPRDEVQAGLYLLALALWDRDCSGAGNAGGCVSFAILANRASSGSNLLQLHLLLQQPVHVVRQPFLDRRGRRCGSGKFHKYSIEHESMLLELYNSATNLHGRLLWIAIRLADGRSKRPGSDPHGDRIGAARG